MEKLKSIILKIFNVKEEDINDEMSPETIPDWDSMNYLMFISDLEDSFNIKFTMNEVMEAKNLGDIKKYLREKGAKL